MPAVEDAVANHHVVSFSSAAAIAQPAPVIESDLNACEPADGIVGQSLALLVDIATEIDKTLELNEGRESDTSATSLVVYII